MDLSQKAGLLYAGILKLGGDDIDWVGRAVKHKVRRARRDQGGLDFATRARRRPRKRKSEMKE